MPIKTLKQTILIFLVVMMLGCSKRVSLFFPEAAVTLSVNEEKQLSVNIPKKGYVLVWDSSDKSVVTVTDGLLKGIHVGTAKITVTVKNTKSFAEIAVTVKEPDPETVIITEPDEMTRVYQTLQLSATVIPATAKQDVVWTSGNTELATVSKTGFVTLKAVGSVIITAYAKAKTTVKAVYSIIISEPLPESVTVTAPGNITSVTAGSTLKLNAEVSPDLAKPDVIWSSSDPSVAIVDDMGYVTGLQEGEVDIIATSEADSAISGKIKITVVIPLPTSITLSAGKSTIVKGEVLQLSVLVMPVAADQRVIYVSDHPDIATVDESGKITGISEGVAVITVTSYGLNSVSESFTVSIIGSGD